MSKKPYFTTADGTIVNWHSKVFCANTFINEVEEHSAERAIMYFDEHFIFSTRSAAQAECDKRNVQ